jgi:hypothetical protein
MRIEGAGVLADPQVRLGIGTAALLVTALAARHDRVSRGEASVFREVNGLPDALYAPAWAIMQWGTLGAVPAAAGAAWLADDRELARGRCPSWSSRWCAGLGLPPCWQARAAAAATPPGWGTCLGTPVLPSLWVLPPFPTSDRPGGLSP